jgi:spore germination cell wall hydrolase CwlJ-like protein
MPDLTPGQVTDFFQGPTERAPSFVGEGDQALASGFAKAGEGAENLAVPLARQQGERDALNTKTLVTAGPDGKLTVQTPATSPILGRAGDAYQAQVASGQVSKIQTNLSQAALDFHNQHINDPQGFKAAWSGFMERTLAGMPPNLAPRVAQAGDTIGNQHYLGLVEWKHTLDTNSALYDTKSSLDNLMNQAGDLAGQAAKGGTDNPYFQQVAGQVHDKIDELAAKFNGVGGVVRDAKWATDQKDAFDQQMIMRSIVGHVDDAFQHGGKPAVNALIDKDIRNNSKINLDQRPKFEQIAEAALVAAQDRHAVEIDANVNLADGYRKQIMAGQKVSDDDIASVVNKLTGYGKFAEAGALISAQQIQKYRAAGVPINLDTSVPAFSSGNGKSVAISPDERDLAIRTIYGEAGGESALGQAAVAHVIRNRMLSGNFGGTNAKDVITSPNQFSVWNDGDPAGADARALSPTDPKYQAIGKIVDGVFGGSLGDPTRGATHYYNPNVASPDWGPGLAARNDVTIGNHRFVGGPGGEGGSALKPIVVAGANGTPFTDQQLQENPFLKSSWVNDMAGDAKFRDAIYDAGLTSVNASRRMGNAPDPQAEAAVIEGASFNPVKYGQEAERILAERKGRPVGDQLADMPVDVAASRLAEMRQSVQGAPIAMQYAAQAAADENDARRKMRAENPPAYLMAKGQIARLPIALDPAHPETIPQAIAERGQVASALAATDPGYAPNAIFPNDKGTVSNILATGPLNAKLAVARGIAALPENARKATLAELGKNSETAPLAVAGDLMSKNPDAASAILNGSALLQQTPNLAPKKDDRQAPIWKALPANDFPDPAMREAYSAAIWAHYADASSKVADVSGNFNQQRFDAAVKAVTGGIVSYRSTNLMAPWYGASQGDFENALKSVTDADMAGSATLSGQPLSAALIKPTLTSMFTSGNYRLISSGVDGKYFVANGPAERPNLLQRQVSGYADQGGPFVLDLGSKRSMVGSTPQVGSGLTDATNNFFRSGGGVGAQPVMGP